MLNCSIAPDSANYTETAGVDVVSTKLDGGFSAFRLDKLGSASDVTVTWSVGTGDYNYLRAFFRQTKAQPFTINLVLDDAAQDTYTAYFQPGTFGIQSVSGETYIVQATLEVQPNDEDDDYDLSLIAVINDFGERAAYDLGLLSNLVNVIWP